MGWLFLLMFCMVIPVYAMAAASETKRLKRVPYLIRLVVTAGIVTGAVFLMSWGKADGWTILTLTIVMVYTTYILFILWSVHRTQDIGMPRWWNLLCLIPIVGIGWWLFLLVKKGPDQFAQPRQ